MDNIIEIIVTFSDKGTAEDIGRRLVEKRLAACAQVGGPIKSIYWWKGKLEETEEWTCALKTRKDLYSIVESEIRSLHPYEVPQIVAFDIGHALPEYREWVRRETAKGGEKQ